MTTVVICHVCSAAMVERTNRQNGSTFLGCSRFPDCTATEKVPAFIEVQRAGGLILPGFGEEDGTEQWNRDHPDGISAEEDTSMARYAAEVDRDD